MSEQAHRVKYEALYFDFRDRPLRCKAYRWCPCRCAALVVRGSLLNTTSFGQLREEGPYHPFAEALATVGLKPLLITCIDVHHVQIATYAVERIGGVLFGVATDLLTLELDLDG
jgi:hypothetical protein